jgi:hypothetical protein
MLRGKVVVRQFARANHGVLVGDCAVLHTTEKENDLELKTQLEETTLHRMAKVHDSLEMW